ncbi:MAG: hypothetical protein ACRCUY_04915 [Thermoguttaceae bacterium]
MSNCCKTSPFQISLCAVIFIVVLRLAIGWHFFYEGIHKFEPSADFSAKGFLGMAKGPAAGLFYSLLPDLDAVQRLEIQSVTDGDAKEYKTFVAYEKAWKEYLTKFIEQHGLTAADKSELKAETEAIYDRYLRSLREGATEIESSVDAYKASMERFNTTKATTANSTPFEQKRRWDAMMDYRRESDGWIKLLESLSAGFQSDLARAISPDLAGDAGHIVTDPEKAWIPNPCVKKQMCLLDLSVMYGLSAIGICMMLGFCNRLACLGGAAFLLNVILTTWPIPGVHPALPTAVGNFLFVSKDAVELVALLMLASMPAGRWGGLDYFLWNCFGGKKLANKVGLGDD